MDHCLKGLKDWFSALEKTAAPNSLWTRYGGLNTMLQIGLGQDLNDYAVLRKNLAKFKKMSPPEKKAKEYEHDEWQRIEQLQGSDKADEIELLIDRCVASLGVFGGIRGRSSEQVFHEWFTGLDVAEEEQGELAVKVPQHLKNLGPNKHDFIIPAEHAKPFFALRDT